MSETTKTLPALFAVCIGIIAFLITKNPVALLMFAGIAVVQYRLRNQPLQDVQKWLFVGTGGLTGALGVKCLIIAAHPVALLSFLMTALCVSVLYTRMKV